MSLLDLAASWLDYTKEGSIDYISFTIPFPATNLSNNRSAVESTMPVVRRDLRSMGVCSECK